MKTSTKSDIVSYILRHEPIGASSLAKHFDISNVMVHRHLNTLIKEGHIIKKGMPPKVYYFMNRATQREYDPLEEQTKKEKTFLEEYFLYVTPDGRSIEGEKWFHKRRKERSLPIEATFKQYKQLIDYIQSQRDSSGLIDVYMRFKKQFTTSYIDGLSLLDVYQVKQFGKSKLAQLAFYGKLDQQYNLIKQVIDMTKDRIYAYIKKNKIDGVCYAPPTLSRPKHQFMEELEKWYNIHLPHIILTKIFSDWKVPQKSLSWTTKRITNAEETIYVLAAEKQTKVKRLLLIDDFIGSGATINICAKKIREKWLAEKIYGIALLGNIDFTYDIINEV